MNMHCCMIQDMLDRRQACLRLQAGCTARKRSRSYSRKGHCLEREGQADGVETEQLNSVRYNSEVLCQCSWALPQASHLRSQQKGQLAISTK